MTIKMRVVHRERRGSNLASVGVCSLVHPNNASWSNGLTKCPEHTWPSGRRSEGSGRVCDEATGEREGVREDEHANHCKMG